MKTEPRDVLRNLLRQYGSELETNPPRTRALLSDLCPECRMEINLIIQAQQIEIPRRLRAQTAHLPVAVVLPVLSRLMEDHYGTSSEPARWAVETWAGGLGMALPAPQPAPPPTPVTPQPRREPLIPHPAAPSLTPVATPPTPPPPPVTPQPTRAPVLPPAALPSTPAAAPPASTFWTPPYGEPVWVEIPAGEFWMGSEEGWDNEKPVHRVYLDRYWIAKTPITNAQYRFFTDATGRKAPVHWEDGKVPRGLESHPVVGVTWYDALAYCKWLSEVTGKAITLPSEAEWEKAARGDRDKREYPWGDIFFDKDHCNSAESGIRGTTPVSKYSPEGASAYGCLDMVGNVREWTRSHLRSYPYDPHDGREKLEAGDNIFRVLRGGAFDDSLSYVRCSYRDGGYPGYTYTSDGFRVVVAPSRKAPTLLFGALRFGLWNFVTASLKQSQ